MEIIPKEIMEKQVKIYFKKYFPNINSLLQIKTISKRDGIFINTHIEILIDIIYRFLENNGFYILSYKNAFGLFSINFSYSINLDNINNDEFITKILNSFINIFEFSIETETKSIINYIEDRIIINNNFHLEFLQRTILFDDVINNIMSFLYGEKKYYKYNELLKFKNKPKNFEIMFDQMIENYKIKYLFLNI